MANQGIDYRLAMANAFLEKNPLGSGTYKAIGGASLIGADLIDGVNKSVGLSNEIKAIDTKQSEINTRADITLAAIAKKGEKVVGAQRASFAKSGVKLEGSALDVLTETEMSAINEAMIARQDADYDIKRLSIAKAVKEAQAKYVPWETAISILGSAGAAGAK